MLTVRPAEDRGHENHGWLDTHHTFSFAEYQDPAHMGFRALRVLNDDRVAGGAGFGAHPHRNMEILTYVLDGSLEHRDSMGHVSVVRRGDLQRMSAGTGVVHSEHNASERDPLHFLQIWILPVAPGGAPSYAQKRFDDTEKLGRLRLVASPRGTLDSVPLAADAKVYAALLERGQKVEHAVAPGRHAWVQVATGRVRIGGVELYAGDGASTSEAGTLPLEGIERAEILVFDLA
jgi:redox-sensitive bicupin YhaK (pirin superfamily)